MKTIDIESIPRSKNSKNQQDDIFPLHSDADRLLEKKRKMESMSIAIRGTKNKLYALCIWFIVFGIGFLVYQRYINKLNTKAQNDVFQAVYYFENGECEKALQGDGIHKGLLEVIEAYPGTKTANGAHLYAAIIYMQQKSYDNALLRLSRFSASDSIVQARAWALTGDAYVGLNKHSLATKFYMKAAHHRSNSIYSPEYLIKAAVVFEADGQLKKAHGCYQEIIDKYPESSQYRLACKEVGRLSVQI